MQKEQKVNRELKASAFTAYFSVPENAASLYEALSGNEKVMPEDISYTTLSDAYLEQNGSPMLELTVKVININLPVNHPILQKCRPLYEYSWFIQKIREYEEQGMELSQAITYTIQDCTKEGIMVVFLRENSSEAVNMLFTEFNMDDALEVRYEEGMQAGCKKTATETAKRLLQGGKLTIEEIAACVGELTVEEIESLKSSTDSCEK